jgi:Ser/Thr protein kinase RdoA (MazF antagonist)
LNPDQPNTLLTTQPPGFSTGEACRMVERYFGFKGTASPLWSERDQNFRFRADSGQQYVLKIANALEDPLVIDFQTRALEHIARTDSSLPVPRTVPDLKGRDFCRVADQQGRKHMVRLITWLDGRIIEESATSPGLLRETGKMLARLGRALRGFSHQAANHHLLWDLKNAAELVDLLPHIEEPELHDHLRDALEDFVERVHPVLGDLRTQVIHADLNRGNILVSETPPERISGIIDFGDMVHTPLIMDLAIAAAYHLATAGDPLGGAGFFIEGYHQVTPLTPVEARILPELMAARLCTSITVQMWRAKLYPENAEYLLVHNRQVREQLKFIRSHPADEMRQQILQICGHA